MNALADAIEREILFLCEVWRAAADAWGRGPYAPVDAIIPLSARAFGFGERSKAAKFEKATFGVAEML